MRTSVRDRPGFGLHAGILVREERRGSAKRRHERIFRATESVQGLAKEAWRARAAWKMEAWRERAEELRVDDSDEYQRILGLATDEGQRLVEKDPDGFVAFVLADSQNPRSTNRADGPP
jgi:hypothetical protein